MPEKERVPMDESKGSTGGAALLLTAIGLLISLLGNWSQHHFAAKAADDAASELALNETKWSVEREKLRAEIDKLQRDAAIVTEDRAKIQVELATINSQIEQFEAGVSKHQIAVKFAQAKLDLDDSKDKNAIDTDSHILSIEKDTLQSFTAERDRLTARRAELERQLGTAR